MSFAVYPSLAGRLVLISGGASGIGAAMVEAFAGQGARVVFLDVDDVPAGELVARLAGEALHVAYLRCDLTDIDSVREVTATILDRFGAVDVLVNNAGSDTRHKVAEVTPESWDRALAVNLKHYFFLGQAVLPGMRRAGRGSIINMSSISWVIGTTDLPVYATAKAGIVGLTRSWAREFGSAGVRVNCVMPGAIQTERQERLWLSEEYRREILARQSMQRMLIPADVSRLVLFLSSDDSSAVTGQNHVIDGGWI